MTVQYPILPRIPVIALALTAACTQDQVMDELTSTPISASAGGIAKSHDGLVELEFPAGAIAADTDIQIRTKRGLLDGRVVTASYEFSPDALTFQKPVEIRLKAAGETRELEIANLDGADPVPLGTSSHDRMSGVITATLEHFSSYGGVVRYDPCRALVCGDTCLFCNPANPNCMAPAVATVCSAAGRCLPHAAVSCQPSPDAGNPPPLDAGDPPPPDAGNPPPPPPDAGDPPPPDAGNPPPPDAGNPPPPDAGNPPPPDAGNPPPPDAGTTVGVIQEVEPNNVFADAQSVNNGLGTIPTISGSVSPAGDIDIFLVQPIRASTLRAYTYSQLGSPSVCNQIDTYLTVYDSNFVQVGANDDAHGTSCSDVSVSLNPGAAYYVEVRHYNTAAGLIPQYYLDILVQ